MLRGWELIYVVAPLMALTLLLTGCGQGEKSRPRAEAQPAKAPPAVEAQTLGNIRNVHRVGSVTCAGQPTESDMALLHDEGVKVVVDLRKPSENRGFDEAAAAQKAGLTYLNPGFSGGDELTDEVFDTVRTALRNSDKKPVLLHCGSANRVGGVWLTYRVLDQGVDFDTALQEAKEIGLRNDAYAEKAKAYIDRQRAEGGSSSTSQ